LAFLEIAGKRIQPTAADLLFANKDYYQEYIKASQDMTLSESLDLAMPGIYEVVKRSKSFNSDLS